MNDLKRLEKELIAIKKLIMLQLRAQGYSPTAIGKALGITRASDVRKLIPNIEPPSAKGVRKDRLLGER